jgi:HPr kinase/phosphorylase
MSAITVQSLIDQLHNVLMVDCMNGQNGMHRLIKADSSTQGPHALVGFLNFIHPNRIQVLGKTELGYLEQQGKNSRSDALAQLFSPTHTAMVLIAEQQDIPDDMRMLADQHAIPLFSSITSSQEAVNRIQYLLGSLLAETAILHGVFMDVMGSGILLSGESGIGKSELALELISRGHRLIADDAPEFSRITPDIINGTCPALLSDFLEVRGLGLLNIRNIFGDNAIKPSKYLRLIISLEKMSEEQLRNLDRLRGSRHSRMVLGVKIPEITLPVAPGRNLAVAIEAAVRNHLLLLKGYDAAEDFIQRQQRLVRQATP